MRTRLIFVGLSVALLALVAWAAFKDTSSRGYIAIQEQYQKDYPGSDFNVQIQQLFPSFPEATIQGDTYRVERCISCHVPDIGTIGPVAAAQRLSQDFFKYEPDAKQLATEYNLTGEHPAYVTVDGGNYPPSESYAAMGADGFTSFTYTPYTAPGQPVAKPVTVEQPGPLPAFLNPATNYGSSGTPTGKLGIDQIGCIVCHNGNRLGLDETDAHQNLIINPVYSFTEGAQLYYQNCARCHGGLGEGGAGPPLNNQDRLGYFNEDYYYRCIEYGFTGFEHYSSIMPNWGAIANDYAANGSPPPGAGAIVNHTRVLSETQINILIQFIRQWENYSTLP
ncbi:MAG TPA: cytochrome c [Candidatus Dormibacteraeota bacterium]